MLNSGQLALARVASGNLSAFLNNTTKIWDVAAGEVLVRAVDGKVTDFCGKKIEYGRDTNVSVLACETEERHEDLLKVIRAHYRGMSCP